MSEILTKYADWNPTAFDMRGLGLSGRQDWFVAPVSRSRESGTLEKSNFEVALNRLGGESDDVEVHRFGHWGPGWFEIILVRPGTEAQRIAEEIATALADYPVLDDDDLSRREYNAACDTWEGMDLDDRIRLCKDAGVSIFASRKDDLSVLPDALLYRVLEQCVTNN